jgi:hypothetical protein
MVQKRKSIKTNHNKARIIMPIVVSLGICFLLIMWIITVINIIISQKRSKYTIIIQIASQIQTFKSFSRNSHRQKMCKNKRRSVTARYLPIIQSQK